MDSKISASSKNFKMMTKRNISSFYFNSITADEVLAEIHNLDIKKANGPEDISIRFIKIIGTILATLLSKIYNASCARTPLRSSGLGALEVRTTKID